VHEGACEISVIGLAGSGVVERTGLLGVSEKRLESRLKRINVSYPAFANDLCRPALLNQPRHRFIIALTITDDLGGPVSSVPMGKARTTRTIVSMPEAAVYEDCLPSSSEDHIRFAWQINSVQAISVTRRGQNAAYHHLR
jgi:hypothetical protein